MACNAALASWLHESSSVLMLGCGGGYDVFLALPLAAEYLLLPNNVSGPRIHLASLSFSAISEVSGRRFGADDMCVEVTSKSHVLGDDYRCFCHLAIGTFAVLNYKDNLFLLRQKNYLSLQGCE